MKRPTVLVLSLAAALALAACQRNQLSSGQMRAHYQRVADIRLAIIQGDLQRAKVIARIVAEGGDATGLPASAAMYITEMRDHAREVADANDVTVAALGTARMAGACGNCHRATHGGPHYSVVGRPEQGAGPLSAAMERHYWAADRMWEGLIGPTDSAWAAGALALADLPNYQRQIRASPRDSADVQALAQQLHQVAVRASLASADNAREEVYGEFLATCATCHQITHGGPH